MTRHNRIAFAVCVLLVTSAVSRASSFPHSFPLAFAVKKDKPKKPKRNTGNEKSSQKGFGVAPPTLEEVASKFRTRVPENPSAEPCPCGSGELYPACCGPYHNKEQLPETPTRVLQSRYSAFAWRLIPYIIETTHPQCRDYRENRVVWAKNFNQDGMFDSFEFIKLEAGPESMSPNNDDESFIEFKVRLRAKDEDKRETVISEKSRFLKDPETQAWYYAGGEVRSEVKGLEDTVLNQ